MSRTWFEVITRKAHWLGDGPIILNVWDKDCGAVYLRASGKCGPKIPGIKYDHVHQVRQMSADESIRLEQKIAQIGEKGGISLFWARAKFFCEDWEFYHPDCKNWTRVLFATDRGKINTCIYAMHYVPNNYKIIGHGKNAIHVHIKNQKSQFDTKVERFKEYLERRGYKVLKHKSMNIPSSELCDIKAGIRERFYAGQGCSLFEAEDNLFCEDPILMKELISNERYWLRKFAE